MIARVLIQALDWKLQFSNQASRDKGAVITRQLQGLGDIALEARKKLISAFVSLVVYDNDPYDVVVSAKRLLIRHLIDSLDTGRDIDRELLLSEKIGSALLSGVMWADLALYPGRHTRVRNLRRWIERINKCENRLVFDAPQPTALFAEFLGTLLKTTRGDSVSYFIRYFSEDRARKRMNCDCSGWSHWFKQFDSDYLLFALVPESIIVDDVIPSSKPATASGKPTATPARPSTKAPVAAKAPTASAAPKTSAAKGAAKGKAKAKVSAAAARLLAATAAPVAKDMTTPTSAGGGTGTADGEGASDPETADLHVSSAQHARYVFEASIALVSAWPMVIASRLAEILVLLRTCSTNPALALPSSTFIRALVQAYVDREAVPAGATKLPGLLFNLLRRSNKCLRESDLKEAEELCAGLHESRPLSGEASALVLPVILALLAPQSGYQVSLVAMHRAIATIAQQLRLGANLESVSLMAIVSQIVRERPTLLTLCETIVVNMRGVDPNQLVELLDCDSTSFRRAVASAVDRLVRVSTPDGSMEKEATAVPDGSVPGVRFEVASPGGEASGARPLGARALTFLLAEKYDQDEVLKRFAAKYDTSGLQLEDAVALLACESTHFRRCVSRAIAGTWSPTAVVPAVCAAYIAQFRPKTEEVPEHLKGFKLSAADLQRIKEKRAGERATSTPGQLGCVGTLTATVRAHVLEESVARAVLRFCVRDAPVEGDLELEKECETACVAVAAAAAAGGCAGAVETELASLLGRGEGAGAAVAAVALGALAAETGSAAACESLVAALTSAAAPLKVKRAVARVLTPLLRQRSSLASLVERAEALAFESKEVRERISGALLLAACIRAQGWTAYGGCDRLVLMATERKEVWARQGAFLAFEAVVEAFGKSIEAQAAAIVPAALNGCGDARPEVRDAAKAVARKLMPQLTGAALHDVLPALLQFADSASWRQKLGAIEMLSTVSAVSSDLIAEALGQVLPVLIEAAHAPHRDVQEAGQAALLALVESVKNPQVHAMRDLVFRALREHSDANLLEFLERFAGLELTHFLDGTAVCMVHTLLGRGLLAAKSDVRFRACQLVGVLPDLVAPEQERPLDADLAARVKSTLPDLFRNLGDPQPYIRQAASRSIGLLAESLGACVYKEALPYLIKSLKTVDNVVERSGCANALVEVFRALGKDVLAQHLPDILNQASKNPVYTVREGFLGLFVYLPTIFGDDFQDFVPDCLPVLVEGLAAAEEPVRDIAFRATRIFVQEYGSSHTPLLLAPLEEAMFHEAFEVRLRAVGLLGTLVDKLLKGVEESTAEGGQQMQLEVLTLERRAYILSAIYLARGDDQPEVKQHASVVWKRVVQNTPRTVKELLPILTRRLMDLLGSGDFTKEGIASRCMEELIAKHGEKLLPEVMGVFLKTLQAEKEKRAFRGVFLGLQAVVLAAPPLLLRKHLGQVLPIIRDSLLSGDDPAVREQVVKAVALMAAAEEEAKKEAAQTKKKPAAKKEAAVPEVSIHAGLLLPLLRQCTAGEDERLLDTVRLLMGVDSKLVLADTLALCREGALTVAKVRTLATLRHAGGTAVASNLRALLRILENGLNTENYAVLAPHVRAALEGWCAALSAEQVVGKLLPLLTDMLELNAAKLTGSASDWRAFARDHDLSIVWSAANFRAATTETQREPRPIAPWSRALVAMAVGALCRGAESSCALWIKPLSTDLFDELLPLALLDLDEFVVAECALMLQSLVKTVDRAVLVLLATAVHRVLRRALPKPGEEMPSEEEELPGRLPGAVDKGCFEGLIAILQPALLYGSAEVKEQAASAFSELIGASDKPTLSAVAVKLAGQLIRGFAERASTPVKRCVLSSLTQLLRVVGGPLRLLVPQLQSSFVRCITDEELGVQAAQALTLLSALAGPRVNLLLSELARTLNEHPQAQLTAVVGVLKTAPAALTPATLTQLRAALTQCEHPLATEAVELIDAL
ncbi:hypothetical protein GNI_037400 [Gregarina niphandrodes]|uniref:TOG domain-containing protein n=1 Tax=Gregarina niphandrodes TaxID=110365 RepID=A0A023BAK4_GRENI|nr:hypothetical protein GNI_037400 [Gregarina niphandrodes]EZG78376.1 hypothetical protein GNI_037400 [Gregarina niphandrodes]|eukprot:XP_011129331.1 hypothetical protein GNI_037400 [Gregarina niphandrodes]